MADTPETPQPPRLISVPKKATVTDLVKPVRRWWKRRHLDDLPEVSLGKAMADVSLLALAELARALTDPKTSPKERVRIALAMGPKLAVQVIGKGGALPGDPNAPSPGHDVLTVYRRDDSPAS